ncbi:MAG: ribosome silencing factor [Bacteroidaceae bacterium]|nr:ribosome silencing factor [Bacteroidaceae bacterium]
MELIDAVIKGIQDKKGHQIVVADLSEIGDTVCKAFVICTASSPVQVQAVAQSVGETVRDLTGIRPTAVDGMRYAQWVAMDYTDVIVHVFLPEMREFYDLEHLWADAMLTELEDLD